MAVESLVVVEDAHRYGVQGGHLLHYMVADAGMHLDDVELLGGEGGRLEQDTLGLCVDVGEAPVSIQDKERVGDDPQNLGKVLASRRSKTCGGRWNAGSSDSTISRRSRRRPARWL